MSALTKVTNGVSRQLGMAGLKIQAHSPQLLVVGGVVTLVGGVVAACIASRKIDKVMDEHKTEMANADDQAELEEAQNEQSADSDADKAARKEAIQKATKRDKVLVYFRTGLKFIKLYLPAACLIGLGVTCFLASNNILTKRNVALNSAFAALSQEFNDYRGRVASQVGEEVEKNLYYNTETTSCTVTTVDEDNKVSTETVTGEKLIGDKLGSMYARIFSRETSEACKRNMDYNEYVLKSAENYCNEKLKARGYFFLNEAYEELGLKICDYGQLAGWIYDPRNEKRVGGVDYDKVEFRYRRVLVENVDVEGQKYVEEAFMIDPNVEGNILQYI